MRVTHPVPPKCDHTGDGLDDGQDQVLPPAAVEGLLPTAHSAGLRRHDRRPLIVPAL